MRPLLLLASATLFGWALAAPALAAPAGFIDCDKAETVDEKAICGSIRLVQQDAQMVTLYTVATGLVGMGTRGDIEDGQVKWLEARHACKDDLACLREAYTSRIGRLQSVLDGIKSHGPF